MKNNEEHELPTTSVPFTELDPKEHRVTYMIQVMRVKEKRCQQIDGGEKCLQYADVFPCCICGTFTCDDHDTLRVAQCCYLHKSYGDKQEECCFCPTCASLPQDVQLAIHTFRQQLNEQQ